MVVAARAADRQAQKGRSGRADAVNHGLDAVLLVVDAAFLIDHRVAVKAGGDQLLLRRVGQKIAGDLLDDEAVERHAAIQGVDHPIAVAPDRAVAVDGIAVRVGVARDVEPVPPPALAVMGRRQQALDRLLVSVGAPVVKKRAQFFRRRRQPRQIEREPAQQRAPVGLGRSSDALFLQLGLDEKVDRVARLRRIAQARRRRAAHRLERPVLRRGAFAGRRAAPYRSLTDPVDQRGNVVRLQRPGGRHFERARSAHRPDEQAGVRLTRNHGRAAAAAEHRGFARGQREAAHFCLVVVALQAVRGQHRPHPLLEETNLAGIVGGAQAGGGDDDGGGKQDETASRQSSLMIADSKTVEASLRGASLRRGENGGRGHQPMRRPKRNTRWSSPSRPVFCMPPTKPKFELATLPDGLAKWGVFETLKASARN